MAPLSLAANHNAIPSCHQTPSPMSGYDDFVLVPSNLPEDPMANSPLHPSAQQQQRPRSATAPGSGIGGIGGRTPVRRIGSKEMLAAAAAAPESPQTPVLRRTSRLSGGSDSPSPTPMTTPSPPTQKQVVPPSPTPKATTATTATHGVRSRSNSNTHLDSQPIPVPSQVEAFKQMESQHLSQQVSQQQQQQRPSSICSISSSTRRSLVSPTPSTPPPPLPSSKPPALPPKRDGISPTTSPLPPAVPLDPPNVQFFLGTPPISGGGKLRRHSGNFSNAANNNVGLPHPSSVPSLRRSGTSTLIVVALRMSAALIRVHVVNDEDGGRDSWLCSLGGSR